MWSKVDEMEFRRSFVPRAELLASLKVKSSQFPEFGNSSKGQNPCQVWNSVTPGGCK